MIGWIALVACTSTPEPADNSVQLGPRFTISDVTEDAHHAGVAWLSPDTLITTWTRGDLGPETRVFVRSVDPVSTVGDAIEEVAADLAPAKADPAVDADGRLWLGFQTELDGIWVMRHDPSEDPPNVRVQVAPQALARGNNSVDVALRAQGGVDLVWYALDGAEAVYRFSSVQADAEQVLATPLILGAGATHAAGAADVAADGNGIVATAFPEPVADDTLSLLLRYRDGDVEAREPWRYTSEIPGVSPRRPTLDFGHDGRLVLSMRHFSLDASPQVVLVAFDADGSVIGGPTTLARRWADRPCVARVGHDRVVLVFEGRVDEVTTVMATALSFPDLATLGAPVALSDGVTEAARAQIAVDDRGQIAVAWEQETATESRAIVARTLTVAR